MHRTDFRTDGLRPGTSVLVQDSVLATGTAFVRTAHPKQRPRYTGVHLDEEATRGMIAALEATLPALDDDGLDEWEWELLDAGPEPTPTLDARVSALEARVSALEVGVDEPEEAPASAHGFTVGDEVVIESNILPRGDEGGFGAWLIGDRYTVTAVGTDYYGNAFVTAGMTLAPESFLKISDLPRLAEERAPSAEVGDFLLITSTSGSHGFPVGTVVRALEAGRSVLATTRPGDVTERDWKSGETAYVGLGHNARPLSPLTAPPAVGDRLVVIDNGGAPNDYAVGEVGTVESVKGPFHFSDRYLVRLEGHFAGMFESGFAAV